METFLEKWRDDEDGSRKKRTYRLLVSFIVMVGLLIALGILFPTVAAAVLNAIWLTLFAVVITFLTLGVLVVVGLKKEVSEVLDIFLEGSLTLLDALEFLRKLWERFKALVREFLVFAAPFFAYTLTLILYIILLTFYKSFGKHYDVTILTIVLTSMLVIFVGILNRPNKAPSRFKQEWILNFGKRFHAGFTDSVEVLLFVFFLTMDSTKLFFLSSDLNHELRSQIGSYNLMHRGINLKEAPGITVAMIIATVSIEILRIIIKLIAMAKLHYSNLMAQEIEIDVIRTKHVRVKEAIQMAFTESKDNLMRFITFNTVLLLVFLFFPRLKLMTLVVASTTSFLLDISMKGRLTIGKGNDLISRMLSKMFKI